MQTETRYIDANEINLDVYCALISKGMDKEAAKDAAMAAAGCEVVTASRTVERPASTAKIAAVTAAAGGRIEAAGWAVSVSNNGHLYLWADGEVWRSALTLGGHGPFEPAHEFTTHEAPIVVISDVVAAAARQLGRSVTSATVALEIAWARDIGANAYLTASRAGRAGRFCRRSRRIVAAAAASTF
jgi:hypothetical protein